MLTKTVIIFQTIFKVLQIAIIAAAVRRKFMRYLKKISCKNDIEIITAYVAKRLINNQEF